MVVAPIQGQCQTRLQGHGNRLVNPVPASSLQLLLDEVAADYGRARLTWDQYLPGTATAN
jgi:hypothetical protein